MADYSYPKSERGQQWAGNNRVLKETLVQMTIYWAMLAAQLMSIEQRDHRWRSSPLPQHCHFVS